jgi:hypothetical protein
MTKGPFQGLPRHEHRFLISYTHASTRSNRLRQILGLWTHPDFRTRPTYYVSSSQMLCQIVPQQATALPSTTTSRQYHPAEITLRFLTFSRFAPSIDTVPITVLRETPNVLQCSLPSAHCAPDTTRSPNCATFVDYVTTLLPGRQRWRQQEGLRLLRLG